MPTPTPPNPPVYYGYVPRTGYLFVMALGQPPVMFSAKAGRQLALEILGLTLADLEALPERAGLAAASEIGQPATLAEELFSTANVGATNITVAWMAQQLIDRGYRWRGNGVGSWMIAEAPAQAPGYYAEATRELYAWVAQGGRAA